MEEACSFFLLGAWVCRLHRLKVPEVQVIGWWLLRWWARWGWRWWGAREGAAIQAQLVPHILLLDLVIVLVFLVAAAASVEQGLVAEDRCPSLGVDMSVQ